MSNPLHLAYFSPLPPARTGIADYSQELLPHLAQSAQLTLFCRQAGARNAPLAPVFCCTPHARYLIVGEQLEAEADLPTLVRDLGLEGVVQ